MTPEAFVKLARSQGVRTERRLRSALRRRYPGLEEWQLTVLTAPPSTRTAGLWTTFHNLDQ
jgi:hypothetical protein